MADYGKRMPLAMARANFSDVNDKVLEDSMKLINESLKKLELRREELPSIGGDGLT